MPLTRGFPVGYDDHLMRYSFTMLNGQHEVECTISSSALSDLVNRWTSPSGFDPAAEFLEFRVVIEAVASDLFDQQPLYRGPIHIFAKHLPKKQR